MDGNSLVVHVGTITTDVSFDADWKVVSGFAGALPGNFYKLSFILHT